MNEARLRSLLREAPIPVSEDSERRGLEVLEAALAEREPRRAPVTSPRRLALALAVAALLGALLLSPAGAAVRDWVDDVLTTAPRPGPGLAKIPGGGRLLVQSRSGPWVVQADGSRRLLGNFEEATWSPRGLYVAAASGRTLTALKPDGTPRWSLSAAAPVSDPRWSPSGYRIAYRSGGGLRVTDANGTRDRLIDPAIAPVAPAWSPLGLSQLAYVGADGSLRFADGESRRMIERARALPGIKRLEWAGETLLEASATALQLRSISVSKLAQGIEVGPPRGLPLPAGATVRDATLSPDGEKVASVLGVRGRLGPRGLVVVFDDGGGGRRLFNAPGRLSEVAWAPHGGRLLIAWPSTDQWLFLPTGRGEGRSVSEVSAAFAPGARVASFPRIEGWCCSGWIGQRG
ncbi:MAG: hypothetical protein JJE35_10490 [Thermoleophilia bacterium]|nr:hypothetical protein [Thermoleophilia bacterium]